MRRGAMRRMAAMSVLTACLAAHLSMVAQTPAPPAPQEATPTQTAPVAPAAAGGRLHGAVKSGAVPLPGVTITAQNTLTGKRYATTSDITGAWALTIPQNGRYVIRTQFAAFAQGAQEAVLKLREGAWVAAEAHETEQLLHGYLAAVDESVRAFVLEGDGPALKRSHAAVAALRALGCDADLVSTRHPVVDIVMFQRLTVAIAEARGREPDRIRRDDERWAAAAIGNMRDVGQTRLAKDLLELECGQWCFLGGFEDGAAARREGGCDLEHRDEEGTVPGDDQADDTDRLNSL